mmetsp:Transcript_19341/g.33184  ORF Transcript_19341/g.33184 Transcript_19341/m.33184 type:complete len:337 (-) Transcript_19341:83-1093(-)|eukprot:CAMPEP_0183729110 /NCGR_PEP_ID=MMETSP0737-20130205/29735_1 /TAXON_ID=385413 /ORGANISM="Thalassiosira miniscula, Strain CCMP1093" /LENGTH=336 /DNA_ID=CAMNT_0025961225 /DNA_START=138 /DNA_END=1151 /DNA_ORIENTATION=+
MTAPDKHDHDSALQAVERSDREYRKTTVSGPCGLSWCEVEALQDAVCGNGLSIMESRDDDTPGDADAGNQTVPVADSTSFIDEILKTFSEELALTHTASMSIKSGSGGVEENSGNPAMVSKLDSLKSTSTRTLLKGQGLEKTRYEHFMSSVDAASKAYGAQSIHVADLYVNMGVECSQPCADAKSKELALLLLEEAFGIYQARAGDSHERTIDCRIHLGKAHKSLGQYEEALDCFCMAVYMREAMLGEPHPSVSEIWVLISSVHRIKSKLELALKASAKALTGYRSAYGDKHPTVIAVLQTIAGIHIEMGNKDKAVDIQKYVRLHSPKKDDAKGEF